MSLAIKFGDSTDASSLSGFIYFDVVTDYSRKVSGKVSSHPLDAGALISDHFVSENPEFRIKGVITGADISGDAGSIQIDGQTPLNTNGMPAAISVSNLGSGLPVFTPDVILQFMGITSPTVTVDESSRVDYKGQIWNILSKLMTALTYDKTAKRTKNQISVITLYELEGNKLEKQYDNCVMTDFQVDEDADSGDGMYFSMSLEAVRFVTLEKVELPKDVADSLKKSSTTKKSKAKVNGDSKTVDSSSTDSPSPIKKPRTLESNAAERDAVWKKLGQ